MITTPVRDDIHEFASAVRAHLDDLPTDEVDDLLDGLEADLSDQAAEAGADFEIPDAATYAAELRAAAGLPERTASNRPRKRLTVIDDVRNGWREVGAAVRNNPVGGWILDLLSSLRPVWWVLRGCVFYVWVFLALMPKPGTGGILDSLLSLSYNALSWVVLATCLVVSVQWGRGRWAPLRWMRAIRTVLTVLAVIAVPVLTASFSSALTQVYAGRIDPAPALYDTPGLSSDGVRIRNIFAFDAEGNPIDAVQLFDQDGNALTTVGREGDGVQVDSYFYGGGGPVPVPYVIPGRSDAWNVFPLREIPAGASTWDSLADVANATTSDFPFARVQPLPAGTVAVPEPAGDQSASPAPTAPGAESPAIPGPEATPAG